MQTILYQGRPREGGNWLALTSDFVACVRDIGYETRELVTRDDAEQAKKAAFDEGVEKAAQAVEAKDPKLAKIIRALKTGGAA